MIKTDTELLSKVEELKYKILHNLNVNQTTENININEDKSNFQDYREIKIIKEINKEDLFNGELNGEELSNAIVIDTDITDYLKNEEVSEYLLSYDIIKKEGFTFDDFVFNIFTTDNSDFTVLLNDSFVSTMDGLKDIEDEIFLSIYIDINFAEQIVNSFGKPVVKIFISFISVK